MNINQAAKQTGLPYSSARKYLVLLEDSGFFKSKIEEGARVFPDEAASLIARLARLSSDGVPLKEAIERLKGGDLEEKTKLDEESFRALMFGDSYSEVSSEVPSIEQDQRSSQQSSASQNVSSEPMGSKPVASEDDIDILLDND